MNSILRRPGYQRQGVPGVPVGWPGRSACSLAVPVRLRRVLGRTGDQVIDSARLVCDDERLSRKWRRWPCLIRSSKTRFSHGWKYVVGGEIETPAGRAVMIRTVWIVDRGQSSPRLVTGYPLVPEKDDD